MGEAFDHERTLPARRERTYLVCPERDRYSWGGARARSGVLMGAACLVLSTLACGNVTRNSEASGDAGGAGSGGSAASVGMDSGATASSAGGAASAGSGGAAAGGAASSSTASISSSTASTTGLCGVGDGVSQPVASKRVVRLTTDQILNSVGALISEELETSLRQVYGQDAFEREALPLLAANEGIAYTESSYIVSDAIADAAGQYVLENFETVTGCAATPTRECTDEFLLTLAARAYRAPLSDAEQTSLLTVVDEVLATDASLPEAVRYGVYAVLNAPQYLYRQEFGQDTGVTEVLAPRELATQLAYFVTDGPPDAALLSAVEQGDFSNPEAWSRETDRLLATPAAHTNIASALHAYFGFQRVATQVVGSSDFTEALRASVQGEVRRVVERAMDAGTVEDLLTSRSSFLDQGLADFYGAAFPPAGATLDAEGFAWTELPEGRAGLLSSAAFLMQGSGAEDYSVPYRGALVLGVLACVDIPPIPEDLLGPSHEAEVLPDATHRERAEYRMSTVPCNGCHNLLDPYGLALEDFDFIGKVRSVDSDGSPIDSSATLVDGASVQGAEELALHLTTDDAFATCLARHFLAYGLSEPPAASINGCTVYDIMQTFTSGPRSLPDLIRAVAISRAFTERLGAQ